MRIANTGSKNEIYINREEGDSEELRNIALRLMPEWLGLFARKNADYGSGSSFDLGVRGQYSDIHRKMIKLRRALWDGESLAFEGVDEIINDLIGHLFLTRHMLEMKEEAERAYAYTEDEAAVDNFLRMMGSLDRALSMAEMLTPPFGELVKAKAKAMLEAESDEAVAKHIHHTIVKKQQANVIVESMDADLKRLQDAGLLGEDGQPRLMTREQLFAGMSDVVSNDLLMEHKFSDGYGRPRLVSPYASLASEEFAEADQAQHVAPACRCHDNEGNSLLPLRDDDPVHPQDDPDDGDNVPAYIDAIPDQDEPETLADVFDKLTDEQRADVKPLIDKLFKLYDKQHKLLSQFERRIRGY